MPTDSIPPNTASTGFFQEAFGIAGLVFGYLVAAWQYQNLAGHFAAFISSRWLGEIALKYKEIAVRWTEKLKAEKQLATAVAECLGVAIP